MKNTITIIFLTFIAFILYFTVTIITEQDNTDSPTYIYHTSSFIENRSKDTNMKNIVEAITVNYRSMDTIGGLVMLFAAIISISSLLRSSLKDIIQTADLLYENTVLKTVVIILLPLCILFSIYTFYYGDTLPGGGFQGGLMLGATMIILSFAFGCEVIENKLLLSTRIKMISIAFFAVILIGLIGPFLGLNQFTYFFPDTFSNTTAEIIRFILSKAFTFCIVIIVGMTITSLFYIMAGEDR